MFAKNTILGQVSLDFHLQYVEVIIKLTKISYIKNMCLQASVGVTPPEKVDVIQSNLFLLAFNVNNLNTQCR